MRGIYGFVAYAYSMIATQTLQDNLETVAVTCGIASGIYTTLYFRAAKKRAETETELTKLKIKQRQLGKLKNESTDTTIKCCKHADRKIGNFSR